MRLKRNITMIATMDMAGCLSVVPGSLTRGIVSGSKVQPVALRATALPSSFLCGKRMKNQLLGPGSSWDLAALLITSVFQSASSLPSCERGALLAIS